MDRFDISIIIPAYNVAGYIERCLDSILAQTFKSFEIIVVDDGSTDATGRIIDEYAGRESRIKVIHKQNAGVSAARNTGIEAARGEYFLFFDGDDFVEPNTCEELITSIREKDVDVLIYGSHRYHDGRITQTSLPIFPEGLYEAEAIIPGLLSRFVGISLENLYRWVKGEPNGLYVENPALWRCIAKAKVIHENNLVFDVSLRVGEDTVFISDLLSCAKRCFVVHKCYYYLVYRESSTIATYEKDAVAKLDGKLRLITARKALTERVAGRSGVDISPYWLGTVVMSCLELAFLFARRSGTGMSFLKRYRAYLQYAKSEEARKASRRLELGIRPGIRLIPLLMLKYGWHFPLFICVAILNLMRYEFVRG